MNIKKNRLSVRHLTNIYRLVLGFISINAVFVGLFMITNNSAMAAVIINPDPGNIPVDIRNYLETSDSRLNSPSVIGWVAKQGSPAQQSMVINSNVSSVDLTYHSIGTVGFRPSSTTRTRYYVESASSGVSGIGGQYNELVFSPNQNTVGATRTDSWDFNFSPPGGFPTTGSYFVELNTKIINEFSNGSFFRCVADGADASSLDAYSDCPLTKQIFEIYITVIPPPVSGCTDITAINYNPSANVDDSSCVYDVCNNLPGNQTAIPDGYSSNGSGGCVYPAPSCGPANNFSVSAGLSFTAKKLFKNDNSVDMPISNATYKIDSVIPSTAANPSSTTITSGTSSEFSTQVHTINYPGVYTITWTLAYEFGTKDCSDDITVTVVEPSCSTPNFSIGTFDDFVPRVTIENSNFVTVNVSSATYLTQPARISGSATTSSVPGPGSATFDAPVTVIDTPGEYILIWTVQWNVGSSSGTINCQTDDTNNSIVSNQPYARFYGNDIFAGGGFGSSCSSSGLIDALGFGRNYNHDTYKGTASELAVFAVGQIQNVLPGSQRSRSSIQELAFGNIAVGMTQVDPTVGKFGGGFGSIQCSSDYYAKASSADKKSETTVDLSVLESGSYSYGDGIVLSTGAGIAEGINLIIYVDGNTQITNSGNSRFGYASAEGIWASVSTIPSLYIIASGNIFVQSDVTTMDGVYVAQPRFDGDNTTGNIYSCANGTSNPLSNLNDTSVSSNAEFISNNCNSKLTVNGAFMASRVHLLRSNNTVNDGAAYETSNSNNAAEVFRFTPEIYLTNGGGLPPRSTNAKIDSIVALPPNF